MLGGLGCCINHARSVSVCSEELRWKSERGNADGSKWRGKCPYERQLPELRPPLWGEEEIPGSAVEMEFHTETKINSPSAAPRSTREGAWLQRRKRRRGSQKGGAFHERSSDWNEDKWEFGRSLGLNDGDKASLCPRVDLHLWWVTDGCSVAGRKSLLDKCYCCIACFIPMASSTWTSVIKTDISSRTCPASSVTGSPSLIFDRWPQFKSNTGRLVVLQPSCDAAGLQVNRLLPAGLF